MSDSIYVIIAVPNVYISENFNIHNVEFFKPATFKFPQDKIEFIDISETQELFKKDFDNCTLAKVPFTKDEIKQNYVLLSPEDDIRIVKTALEIVEGILDLFRFIYCDFLSPNITIPKCGNVETGTVSAFIKNNDLPQKFTRINMYFSRGIGETRPILLDVNKMLNVFGDTKFQGEFGNYLKQGLRQSREIIFQENLTTKFMQIMNLFEYLAYPEEFKKFIEVKKEIASLVAENTNDYEFLLERFHELTSKEGFAYRTEIVHNGKSIFEFSTSSDFLNSLFFELQFYFTKYLVNAMKFKDSDKLIDFYTFRKKSKEILLEKKGLVVKNTNITRDLLIVDLNYFEQELIKCETFYKKKWKNNIEETVRILLRNCRLSYQKGTIVVIIGKKDLQMTSVNKMLHEEISDINIHYIQKLIETEFAKELESTVNIYSRAYNRFFEPLSNYEKIGIVADDSLTSYAVSNLKEKMPYLTLTMLHNYHDSEIESNVPYVNISYVNAIILDIPKENW